MKIELSPDQEFITVTIPIGFKRRGSRRLIIAPDVSFTGEAPTPPRSTRDDKLIQAIARAFQWQEWIENGKYADTHDLAAKIKVERSYVSRAVRLTLLAPDIIESILDGTQPRCLTLQQLIRGFLLACGANNASNSASLNPSHRGGNDDTKTKKPRRRQVERGIPKGTTQRYRFCLPEAS